MKNPTLKPWKIRAVQIDLARQKENLESIREFIHFARDWGYNTLVLYLEGVIRTKSFPFRKKELTYSPAEIRSMVDMAKEAGLDVIPAMNTLGHAEHFLECKELSSLAETGSACKNMFCPSNEGTYRFLEKYLQEVAALFPGKHFHIGCDETGALGACPVCHARLRKGESREDLLIAHILRVYPMIKKLGKRIWIWDDMFENDHGEKLSRLPRDIVMCAWHYSSEYTDMDGVPGQFNNLKRYNPFRRYEKFGFDVVACPWARNIDNVSALTLLAREYKVLGGLQTNWELSTSFLPSVFPSVAFAGALWSNPARDPETVLIETLHKLFPRANEQGLMIIRGALDHWHSSLSEPQSYLRGTLTHEEVRNLNSAIVYRNQIAGMLKTLPDGQEKALLSEIHTQLRLLIWAGRQRRLLPKLIDPRIKILDRNLLDNQTKEAITELDALAACRTKDWLKYRRGILPERASSHIRQIKRKFEIFIKKASSIPYAELALVNVRLFLADSHRRPVLRIEVIGPKKREQIYRGTFKPYNPYSSIYILQVPLHWKTHDPEKILFTVNEYGGQGILYTSIAFHDRTLIPHAISSVSGDVENATALLVDDTSVCLIGDPDLLRTSDLCRENDESSVEILLKPLP